MELNGRFRSPDPYLKASILPISYTTESSQTDSYMSISTTFHKHKDSTKLQQRYLLNDVQNFGKIIHFIKGGGERNPQQTRVWRKDAEEKPLGKTGSGFWNDFS